MTILPHGVAALLAVLALCAACGAAEGSAPDVPAEPPTLLVNEDAQGYFEATVSGRTGVNAQGCVTVGDRLLVAPEGSRLTGGTTLEVTGYEPVEIGADVQWTGGGEERPRADADPAHVACSDPGADPVEVAVVAPGP